MSRKVTTESTNKSIKLALLLFGLGFTISLCGFILEDQPIRGWFGAGIVICAVGFFAAKVARWWENE